MPEWRCIGCGGPLQNTSPDAPFYTPKSYQEGVPIYCERCYKIRHYGQIKPSFVSERVLAETLTLVESRPGILLWTVDALDFYGSMHPDLIALSAHKRTLLIVNKIDVLPKSLSREKLRQAYLTMAHDAGVSVEDLVLVSALKKTDIDTLIERTRLLSKGQDVTLVGVSNVGKSSVLNAMLGAQQLMKNPITTSFEANITQGLIPFRLKDYTLYDTPGLRAKHAYRHYLSGDSLRRIMPFKEIKPTVFQTVSHRSFFLGGLAYLSFTDEPTGHIATYVANTLLVHARLDENPEAFYDAKVGHLLNPPATTDPSVPLKRTTFELKGAAISVFFPGLGFVRVWGAHAVQVATYEPIEPILHPGVIG
mgnify:CR=1 FL=1